MCKLPGAAPATDHDEGSPRVVISGLNRTAFDLAVYASQGRSPTHHARLASGCWSGSTGRDWLPAGFHLKGFKFPGYPPFPSFLRRGQTEFQVKLETRSDPKARQGKRVATFALVTTAGPQPRPARSTPGEPGRAADRQAFASLSCPTHRQVLRNPLCRAARFPRDNEHPSAHRPSAWATRGLAAHTELTKMVGTIPTYIVYDKIARLFRASPEE